LAGIYIHIPFCKKSCNYCNFHFSTSLRYKDELVDALLKEVDLTINNNLSDYNHFDLSETIDTIYFGGGTPSLLSHEELNKILTKINAAFMISTVAEITIEANPDDITEAKLIEWKTSGINRLSIGIQSFYQEDLEWMNRAHNKDQAKKCIELAHKHGFYNISIDLIYGTPLLTNEKWQENVKTALSFNIPHLSCYALTIEPKTILHKLIEQKKVEDVNPDQQSEQFLLLMKWLQEAGYEHYEISNFAKPGFRSRHNSSYWSGKKYFGFGPSAHSYDGENRFWNIANNNVYITTINDDKIPFEKETLSQTQRLNELVMISLRTMEGLSLQKFEKLSDEKSRIALLKAADKYINSGLLKNEDSQLTLTAEGKLLADGIAADLFLD
jgi:oxygen-independent coproporphyrinogen III oxidase